jgi:hypothetical protein
MFAPIFEIPFAERFFRRLGKLPVANPRIEGAVVKEKVWSVRHGRLGHFFNDVVFLGVGETCPATAKDSFVTKGR